MAKEENKVCFVIAPIGDADSDIRKRSDQILKHVICPAAKSCGYEALRADQISEPGIITTQVIQHIIEDPMVVADLTGRNPNVFYELAVRHALRKPYLHIIQRGERIPFDVAAIRTVEVDHKDLDSVDAARDELVRQMKSMQAGTNEVDSPISVAVDLDVLRQSGNPEQRQLADVLAALSQLQTGIGALEKRVADPLSLLPPAYLRDIVLQDVRSSVTELAENVSRRSRLPVRVIEDLMMHFERLSHILETPEGKEPNRARMEEARELARRTERMLQMLMVESGMASPRMMEELFERRMIPRKKPE